jgi:hypothetical protein
MSWLIAKSTIADIRRTVNITTSTVSWALNDHPAISESTKSKLFAPLKNKSKNRTALLLRYAWARPTS